MLQRLVDLLHGEKQPGPVVARRGHGRHFEGIQRDPRVAARHGSEVRHRLVFHFDVPSAQSPLAVLQRPPDDPLQVVLGQRLQAQHPAAGQEGGIDLEGRVLRGRADEGQRAVFHGRQHGVLLQLVESMDLVDEQDGPLAVHAQPVPGLLRRPVQVLHAGAHSAQRHEVGIGGPGDDEGERGLARARRPPQDHRKGRVPLDGLVQEAALSDQRPLAQEIVQRIRPHPRCQRRFPAQLLFGLFGEEIGHG